MYKEHLKLINLQISSYKRAHYFTVRRYCKVRTVGLQLTAQPAATVVKYVNAIRITEQVGRLVTALTVILAHAACEQTHNNCRGPLPKKGTYNKKFNNTS
jgi:hypothetical protein